MSTNTSLMRSRSLKTSASNTVKPPPSIQQTGGITGLSHITTFLTNLRLLDLDQRDDWPGITALTFSTKDTQQNQKKRIQSVEWALYQLFVIWDAEEARNKLQPFFPPLEPLQSLNLRAALFRCLDQAKKNGVLGRDSVLRKTMLDECKGEKLEELLAVFSTAVLKRIVQEVSDGHDAIAQKMALENFSYTGGRTTLSTLILAHKISLKKGLSERQGLQAKYTDLSDLLKLKDRQITRRHEQVKDSIEKGRQDAVEDEAAETLREKLENNWSGSNEWLKTILHGDSRYEKDGLLTTSFDDIWKRVEDGSIGELEDQHERGLLEQLESRIREQNHRLAQWRSFGKKFTNEMSSPSKDTAPVTRKNTKGIDLGFGEHLNMQLSRKSAKDSLSKNWEPLEEYSRLIKNLNNELANVGRPRSRTIPTKSVTPAQTTISPEPGLQEELVPLGDEHSSASETDTDEPSPGFEKFTTQSMSQTPPSENAADRVQRRSSSPVVSTIEDAEDWEAAGHTPSRPTARPLFTNPIIPAHSPPLRPSSSQAEQILASMATTSPSPTKPRHVLSLAERTRLSMARTSIAHLEDFDDLPDLSEMTRKAKDRATKATTQHHTTTESSRTSSSRGAEGETPAPSKAELHSALLERTRQSMSNSASVAKTAQLERRRSSKLAARNKRMSYMPAKPLTLDTTAEVEVVEKDGIDRMKLIEADAEADYETVFKSRPRIKTSPERSPVKTWGDMGGLERSSSPPEG